MFGLIVLYVLVMFLFYLSIYPVSTRVLAYCSGVRRLPPQNYEGGIFRGSRDNTSFFNGLLDCIGSAFPISLFFNRTSEPQNNWTVSSR